MPSIARRPSTPHKGEEGLLLLLLLVVLVLLLLVWVLLLVTGSGPGRGALKLGGWGVKEHMARGGEQQ